MNKTTHSVMFHHLHNAQHPPAQGSLSPSDFTDMIDWLNKNYSLLNAGQYKESFENGTLNDADICLSFDDALKCQYDIAVPIMERLGIEAFFFVYSSAFSDNPDPLEIYRYFRTTSYCDIEKFYKDFFKVVEQADIEEFSNQHSKYQKLDYLSAFPFYTENDKWFRYLRDRYLIGDQYNQVMKNLMLAKGFDLNLAKQNLWMSEEDLLNVQSKGHLIGLHSYTHPTRMSELSRSEQKSEYQRNYEHLSKLIGKPINVMSHPCGDYNETTLGILAEMNIEIGFRSNMSVKEILSPLEIPREDHANVFKEMRS